MTYPDKNTVVDALIEAASRTGKASTANHPQDIADAMINSMELGAVLIQVLHEKHLLVEGPPPF